MLGLTNAEAGHNFTTDRTWTTRARRPAEDDQENVFVEPVQFERKRSDFLFTFQTFPTYEYGIEKPPALSDNEIRMRILMPTHARLFRKLVDEPVLFCAIAPFNPNPEDAFRARDPNVDPKDLSARMGRFYDDQVEANAAADVCFQNCEGLEDSVARLANLLTVSLLDHQAN